MLKFHIELGKTLPKEETILYKCGPSRGEETFQNKPRLHKGTSHLCNLIAKCLYSN